jgi:hypothetical protein
MPCRCYVVLFSQDKQDLFQKPQPFNNNYIGVRRLCMRIIS